MTAMNKDPWITNKSLGDHMKIAKLISLSSKPSELVITSSTKNTHIARNDCC
jgi:hypothetical protein